MIFQVIVDISLCVHLLQYTSVHQRCCLVVSSAEIRWNIFTGLVSQVAGKGKTHLLADTDRHRLAGCTQVVLANSRSFTRISLESINLALSRNTKLLGLLTRVSTILKRQGQE